MDSTNVTYLYLDGHVELEKYRYVYFGIVLLLYLLIIGCNSVVIFVIYVNKYLHEPMYILIAALLCNSLVGTTALYPKLLNDFLSERQVISYQVCLFQAFFIYTYLATEHTLLSAMAYDRYVSICNPLNYATLVKISTVKKLILCCWLLPSCEISIGIMLTTRLQLCSFRMSRIYCDNYLIVKLACGDISVVTSYGFFVLCVNSIPTVSFLIFSYIRILSVCLKNSRNFRRKALQTCFPHLLSFGIFAVTSCFEVIGNRFESRIPLIISMILSVENMVIPPLINPMIYGLKLKEVLNAIKRLLCKGKKRVSF